MAATYPHGNEGLPERFWAKVDLSGDCWLWQAALDDYGYGRFRFDARPRRAHRLAYESLVGPIPPGLVLDHLCRTRACVNPAHLEPVTNAENVARGALRETNRLRAQAQTHCRRGGHPLSGDNLKVNAGGRRECRACRREREAERRRAA